VEGRDGWHAGHIQALQRGFSYARQLFQAVHAVKRICGRKRFGYANDLARDRQDRLWVFVQKILDDGIPLRDPCPFIKHIRHIVERREINRAVSPLSRIVIASNSLKLIILVAPTHFSNR
tara:strand:+ start:2007 stop:2366 length:360 start_codon:yes stop_codon:yes gene_type:complete